jgi:hypothetical protein
MGPFSLEAFGPATLLAAALGLAAGIALCRHLRARQAARRRAAAYRLMDSLKAYSAWMDCQRDEPIFERSLEELSTPAPLLRASQIRDEWFPELAGLMVRLLQSHRMMMEYLWEQNLMHMGGGGRAMHGDARYRELEDLQDATLDSLFLRVRELIGQNEMKWHRTRSDFSFSSGENVPSHPSQA